MKTLLIAAALALAAPLAARSAGSLEILQPWSRPAVAGTNAIGYMVLANHGRAADVLEKVESPIAGRVEMHSSSMAGGVMSMKREDKVAVPAGRPDHLWPWNLSPDVHGPDQNAAGGRPGASYAQLRQRRPDQSGLHRQFRHGSASHGRDGPLRSHCEARFPDENVTPERRRRESMVALRRQHFRKITTKMKTYWLNCRCGSLPSISASPILAETAATKPHAKAPAAKSQGAGRKAPTPTVDATPDLVQGCAYGDPGGLRPCWSAT